MEWCESALLRAKIMARALNYLGQVVEQLYVDQRVKDPPGRSEIIQRALWLAESQQNAAAAMSNMAVAAKPEKPLAPEDDPEKF